MSEEFNILGKVASLNENESMIYSLMLADGNITKGDLIILSGLSEEEVDEILTKLENERLIVRHTGVITRFHAVPPFHGIAEEVENIGERIQSLRDEIRQQISNISSTIRNHVLEVSNSAIITAKDNETKYESHKNQALDQIRSLIGASMSRLSDTESSSEGLLESDFAEWKNAMSGEIDPNVSEIKNSIISVSSTLKSQMKSWSGSARMSIKALDQNASTTLNQFKTLVSSEIEKQKQSSEGSIEQKGRELQEGVQTTLNDFNDRMNVLKGEITSTSSSLREQIVTSLNGIDGSITTTLEQKSDELTSMLNSLKNETQSAIAEFQDIETSAHDAHKASLHDTVGSFKSSITDDLEALDRLSSEALESFVQDTDTTFSSIDDQLNGLLKQVDSHIQVVSERMFQLNKDTMTAFHQRAVLGFNDMARNISSALSETHASFSENIKSTGAQLTKMNVSLLESSVIHVNKTKEALINEIHALSENMRARVNDVVSTAIAELQKLSDDLQESIASLTSSASSSIAMQAESRISELQEHHDLLQPKIDDFINQEVSNHERVLANLNDMISDSGQRLDDDLSGIREQNLAILQSALENAKETGILTIAQLRDESKEILDALKTSYTGITSDIRTSLKSTISAANNELVSATEQMTAGITEHVSTRIEHMREATEQLNSRLSKSFEQAQQSIASTIRDTVSQSSTALSSATEQASAQLEEMNTASISAIDLVMESMANSATSFQSGLNNVLDNVKQSLASLLDEISSVSIDSANDVLSQTNSIISSLDVELDNLQTSAETGIDSLVADSKQGIDDAAQRLKESTAAIAEQFKTSSAKALQKSTERLKSELDGLKDELEISFEASFNQFIEITSSFRNEIKKIASEVEKGEMLETSQELLEKAFPSSESIADTGTEVVKMLASVWSKIGATNFPGAKKTWTITSREVVLAHIKDMIGRAKSKATLIFPFIHDVPVEMLSQLKTTTGVEVVVTDEPGLNDRLSSIIGKGNIRVRVRSGRDVYACVRDSEEVLLAPATDRDEDVVGVLTVDDGFVKFIMGIIGPIFQAKTKLLRPEDL